jgi:hypothetical protein
VLPATSSSGSACESHQSRWADAAAYIVENAGFTPGRSCAAEISPATGRCWSRDHMGSSNMTMTLHCGCKIVLSPSRVQLCSSQHICTADPPPAPAYPTPQLAASGHSPNRHPRTPQLAVMQTVHHHASSASDCTSMLLTMHDRDAIPYCTAQRAQLATPPGAARRPRGRRQQRAALPPLCPGEKLLCIQPLVQ